MTMIVIQKLGDVSPNQQTIQRCGLLLAEQDDGQYLIVKNRYGPYDILIPSDLLIKVINNPSGDPVTKTVDWV